MIVLPQRTWTLVRDKRTGHHYDVQHVNPKVHEVLSPQPTPGTPRPVKAKPKIRLPKAEPQAEVPAAEVEPVNDSEESTESTPKKRAAKRATKENPS